MENNRKVHAVTQLREGGGGELAFNRTLRDYGKTGVLFSGAIFSSGSQEGRGKKPPAKVRDSFRPREAAIKSELQDDRGIERENKNER